jgi:FdhD protein
MEKEFITGYLFGQGFINNTADIISVEFEDGTAQVTLKNKLSPAGDTDYRIVSGGGRSAYYKEPRLHKIETDIEFHQDAIFSAMNTLFRNAELYGETEGVHAAGLFTVSATPLCMVEDIGRHNTLDKIIGYILLNKIDTAKTFLVSTGRMASEMVIKICRGGIPVAATKTAVTDKGLEIAKKYGLTLIGFLRDAGTRINTDMDVRIIKEAGMKIYNGAERVRCD